MGYTHYWENSANEIPEKALELIRYLLDEAYAEGVIQREFDTKKPPLVTRKSIQFNGVGELGHETFFFNVDDDYRTDEGRRFAFCKTGRKPYDRVVMQVLIVLKWALDQQLEIRSDGRFDDEWQKVRAEMAERYSILTYVRETLITE